MSVTVREARHIGPFTVWVKFSDGTAGEIDLSGELEGPVFEPLTDPAVFSQVRYNHELRTICWPNGADFAPEFLRERLGVTVP